MKTFWSCPLIIYRHPDGDCRCVCDFIDAGCLGGEVFLPTVTLSFWKILNSPLAIISTLWYVLLHQQCLTA